MLRNDAHQDDPDFCLDDSVLESKVGKSQKSNYSMSQKYESCQNFLNSGRWIPKQNLIDIVNNQENDKNFKYLAYNLNYRTKLNSNNTAATTFIDNEYVTWKHLPYCHPQLSCHPKTYTFEDMRSCLQDRNIKKIKTFGDSRGRQLFVILRSLLFGKNRDQAMVGDDWGPPDNFTGLYQENKFSDENFYLSQEWNGLPYQGNFATISLKKLENQIQQNNGPDLIIMETPVLHPVNDIMATWPRQPSTHVFQKSLNYFVNNILKKLEMLMTSKLETKVVIFKCNKLDFRSSSIYSWQNLMKRVIYPKQFDEAGHANHKSNLTQQDRKNGKIEFDPLSHRLVHQRKNYYIDIFNDQVQRKVEEMIQANPVLRDRLFYIAAPTELSPFVNQTFLVDSVHLQWKKAGPLVHPMPVLANINLMLNAIGNLCYVLSKSSHVK